MMNHNSFSICEKQVLKIFFKIMSHFLFADCLKK